MAHTADRPHLDEFAELSRAMRAFSAALSETLGPKRFHELGSSIRVGPGRTICARINVFDCTQSELQKLANVLSNISLPKTGHVHLACSKTAASVEWSGLDETPEVSLGRFIALFDKSHSLDFHPAAELVTWVEQLLERALLGSGVVGPKRFCEVRAISKPEDGPISTHRIQIRYGRPQDGSCEVLDLGSAVDLHNAIGSLDSFGLNQHIIAVVRRISEIVASVSSGTGPANGQVSRVVL